MNFRLSLIKNAEKYGVTKAAIKYRTNRQNIYRWKRRYDGSLESLRYRSQRPHHHPNQHTEAEITLINNMRRRNPDAGNVKYVPQVCLVNEACGQKFYQYTAIDEYSRWRYVEVFNEHSTYLSMLFLKHLIKAFPMPIECFQIDNGFEFTKRFSNTADTSLTIFEKKLARHGIRHKKIRPFTPRHIGKVERSHRKDNERFYATHSFYSFQDFSKQLNIYNRRDYNHFPMRPLGWKSPYTILTEFIKRGVTYV